MTATVTDLFCGAGGSSTGAAAAGLKIVLAANHWQTAIDVHQVHHPDAAHDCADISQVDPRRYPRTDVLLASPECTNHSQARGISRKRQDPTLWDAPDPSAERSRATMWDVVRFAEQMPYDAIVVENVVEATKWTFFGTWLRAMTVDLGYEHRILSHNSMHHGVPQSRDRIYVVFWRKGLKPNLELELVAWCARCDLARPVRQAWKNGRTVGRYRQQWVWACTSCGWTAEPPTSPAATIIDWELACPRIGDRARPLAPATRARILAGLQRYGWAPITTAGAGNVWEATPGMRARPVSEPTATMQTTATQALATPPEGMFVQTGHGSKAGEDPASRTRPLSAPTWTVTASDDRPAFVVPLRSGRNRSHGVDEPLATVVAGGNYGGLVLANTTNNVPTPVEDPLSTVVAGTQRHGLVVPLRRHGQAKPTDEPVDTVTAAGNHHALVVRNYGNEGGDPGRHVTPDDEPVRTVTTSPGMGLLMRNNGTKGEGWAVTPTDDPARTMTTKGHQSLLVPYNGNGGAKPDSDPLGTQPATDRWSLVDPELVVDDCGFRMLEPYEIAAAMAFAKGYIPRELTKRDQVKLAGNAVTPPVMTWITGRLLQALEAAG